MNYFAILAHANLLYRKNMHEGYENVDVVTNMGGESPDITVSLEAKDYSLRNSYIDYLAMKKKCVGTLEEVDRFVRDFIEKVGSLELSCYKDFSKSISSLFFDSEYSLLKKIADFAQQILYKFKSEKAENGSDFNFRVSLADPAYIVVEKGDFFVGYVFNDKRLVILGVEPNEGIYSLSYPLSTEDTRVSLYTDSGEMDIFEHLKLKPSVCGRQYLIEGGIHNDLIRSTSVYSGGGIGYGNTLGGDFYYESTDDIMDEVLKILAANDLLDTLLDMVADEHSVVLLFDPILKLDEINKIFILLKSQYSSCQVTDALDEGYWIIEIVNLAAEEMRAVMEIQNTQSNIGDKVSNNILANIDIGKAVSDAIASSGKESV